jgi:hypothetical protein
MACAILAWHQMIHSGGKPAEDVPANPILDSAGNPILDSDANPITGTNPD